MQGAGQGMAVSFRPGPGGCGVYPGEDHNSTGYVDKIRLDTSKELAEMQAKQDAKLKEAEQARSGEVADVRFAEDARGEYLDRAGMDESDLKYMDKLNEDVPQWKLQKKQRSQEKTDDDSLEALIGVREETKGVDGSGIQEAAEKNPVLMLQQDKDLANRLDGLNLNMIRLLILLGLIYLVSDYLHRANSYTEAYLPMPVPSAWLDGMAPVPPLITRSATPRRTMDEELVWLTRRGDTFVYMTDKPGAVEKVPERIPSVCGRFRPVDVMRVNGGIDDQFVFESLWYGRSSFVVDSSERAVQMLGQFVAYLSERKSCRAKVRQTVHIIWDVAAPLSEEWQVDFAKLTKATGMSLVVCQ
jgi:hypothetical protein